MALLHNYVGVFDCNDLSIISTAAVREFGTSLNVDLDTRRFRANIVVEAAENIPFPEDRWVGEMLIFGERSEAARVHINRKDVRCEVVNVCPTTAEKDPRVLQEIVSKRKNRAGVYAQTLFCGLVKVGDPVFLLK